MELWLYQQTQVPARQRRHLPSPNAWSCVEAAPSSSQTKAASSNKRRQGQQQIQLWFPFPSAAPTGKGGKASQTLLQNRSSPEDTFSHPINTYPTPERWTWTVPRTSKLSEGAVIPPLQFEPAGCFPSLRRENYSAEDMLILMGSLFQQHTFPQGLQ